VQPLLQWKSRKYSVIYIVCVFVAVGVLHAMRMRLIICGLSGSAIFCTLYHNGAILEKKVIGYKMCVLILCTCFV